ncbi:SDR family oxidoreductase [Lampropedia puyangensis]|uniref:SDR family oxidoreductase n=1 Tax=Lampropedia puyangensis TaxID=1330072 RepID=A0A4S8F6R1_9BURK|nr:SDR family oxidoreductase [Lampropedia puyangensis]THU02789.1 SDR family oxidoreductase [Lampropedia puyangensis]
MNYLIIGASKGLGKAFVEGLGQAGDHIVGISRQRPTDLTLPTGVSLDWIEADMSQPLTASQTIAKQAPDTLDVLIYNLGVWEELAFTDTYRFEGDSDAQIMAMVNTNITAALLLIKHLMPKLLESSTKPQIILTGSTSGLRQSGRPEVVFGTSKFALTGMADALRESYRNRSLAVTSLQLGYLNTEDALATPIATAAARGEGGLIPVHDVVSMVRALTRLSNASFVRELVLPAIADERF